MRLAGSDSNINLKTPHQEFSDWRWVPIGELLPMTVPFKRETYAQVIAAFADIAKKSE